MNSLDPSVTDEADPLSIDPALFPFSSENGYSPEGARYAPGFVSRYCAAQRRRVERIDTAAREMVQTRMQARKAAKVGKVDAATALTAG